MAAQRRTGDDIAIPGDYQYRALTRGFVVQRYWHASKLKLVDALLPVTADDRVLDCGCGSGVVSAHLATRGAHVVGIDTNPDAVAFARSMFGSENLTFAETAADEIADPLASFSKILFLEVLEHLYADQAVPILTRFRELLRPGGQLLVTTPNYRGTWPILEAVLDRLSLTAHMHEDQHVARWTRDSLVRVVGAAGLVPRRVGTYSTIAPFAAILGEAVADRFFRAELRSALPFGNLLYVLAQKPSG